MRLFRNSFANEDKVASFLCYSGEGRFNGLLRSILEPGSHKSEESPILSEKQSNFGVEQPSFQQSLCLTPISAIFTTYENQVVIHEHHR